MDGKTELKTVSDVLQTVDIAHDGYDDVFSDFDPSPYGTRILSEDFLRELHRRYFEKRKGDLAVNFTLPKALRNEKTEILVRKRIKDMFRERLKDIEKKVLESRNRGIWRMVIGAVISLAVLLAPELETVPIVTILSVLIWYALWTGFDALFDNPMRLRKRRAFYEKFIKAEFKFFDQESVALSIQKLSVEPQKMSEPSKAVPAKELPAEQKPAEKK